MTINLKPVNVKLTISEASRELGYSSRSQLYNLTKRGYLNNYLYVDNKGRKYLEMHPVGRRALKDYLPAIIKWRSDCVHPSELVDLLFYCLLSYVEKGALKGALGLRTFYILLPYKSGASSKRFK